MILRRGSQATRRAGRAFGAGLAAVAATACSGPLSTLDPAGDAAAWVADLWWVMLAVGTVILFGIMGTALYALLRERRGGGVSEVAMLAGGGVVFPAVTLLALMFWSVVQGPEPATVDATADSPAPFRIRAQGHQFWWEFIYPDAPGGPLYGAAEAVIPAAAPVVVEIASDDVIHSFWVPRLAGKLDALPGRVNHLRLSADRPGLYAGQCAEFCGNQHLAMRFVIEAVAAEDIDARLARLAATAPDATLPGAEDFADHCAGCHSADPRTRGGPGPNLAAVATRSTLGGVLPYRSADDLRLWLTSHRALKPGSKKPEIMADAEALDRIIDYLESARP